jgi:hypothetical protein
MAFYDAFFGSDQSLYTAYAIIAAIIAICITILLTATDVSVGNRILIVLFVIVTLIPSIFLTLFEITCMVTGGTEPNRWWCYAFAWVLAAFIIIYCIFVVIISLVSLFTYNSAIDNINEIEQKNKLSDIDSNHIAKQIIHTDEEQKKIEKFYNSAVNANVNEQFKQQFVNNENIGAEPLAPQAQPPAPPAQPSAPQSAQPAPPAVPQQKQTPSYSNNYDNLQDNLSSVNLNFSSYGENDIMGAGSTIMNNLYELKSFTNDAMQKFM